MRKLLFLTFSSILIMCLSACSDLAWNSNLNLEFRGIGGLSDGEEYCTINISYTISGNTSSTYLNVPYGTSINSAYLLSHVSSIQGYSVTSCTLGGLDLTTGSVTITSSCSVSMELSGTFYYVRFKDQSGTTEYHSKKSNSDGSVTLEYVPNVYKTSFESKPENFAYMLGSDFYYYGQVITLTSDISLTVICDTSEIEVPYTINYYFEEYGTTSTYTENCYTEREGGVTVTPGPTTGTSHCNRTPGLSINTSINESIFTFDHVDRCGVSSTATSYELYKNVSMNVFNVYMKRNTINVTVDLGIISSGITNKEYKVGALLGNDPDLSSYSSLKWNFTYSDGTTKSSQDLTFPTNVSDITTYTAIWDPTESGGSVSYATSASDTFSVTMNSGDIWDSTNKQFYVQQVTSMNFSFESRVNGTGCNDSTTVRLYYISTRYEECTANLIKQEGSSVTIYPYYNNDGSTLVPLGNYIIVFQATYKNNTYIQVYPYIVH